MLPDKYGIRQKTVKKSLRQLRCCHRSLPMPCIHRYLFFKVSKLETLAGKSGFDWDDLSGERRETGRDFFYSFNFLFVTINIYTFHYTADCGTSCIEPVKLDSFVASS